MIRHAAGITAAAALMLGACSGDGGGDDDPVALMAELVEFGSPCESLFSVRDRVDPDDSRLPEMNERLRAVGCFARGSERTDTTADAPTTTSTTRPESPVETYENRLRARIKIELRPGESGTGDGYAELVVVGERICDAMSTVSDAAAEDHARDTPESDALVAALGAEAAVDVARIALHDDRIVAVFLRTTTYYLCPEHEALIEAQLDSLGL